MEIDLIDNVPCSHCEQLVPCEHNPETSSKNFPPQTFNPSSSFCPSLQKMKRGDAREDKILSCQVPAKQVEMWSRGKGSRIKRQGRRNKRGREHEQKGLRYWEGQRIDQNSFPILLPKIHSSSLCLIGNTWFWSSEYCAGTITPYLQALPGEVAFGRSVPPWEWLVA